MFKPNGQSLKHNFISAFPKNGYGNYPKWAPQKDRTEEGPPWTSKHLFDSPGGKVVSTNSLHLL